MSKKNNNENIKSQTGQSVHYLYLLENSKDTLYLINAKTGKLEYASPAVAELTGFTPDEIINMNIAGINERTHPDDRWLIEETKDILAGKSSGGNSYIEIRFKHKNGRYVWLGINRNTITDSAGRIEAVIGNGRDITETKQLQEQLQSALDNYKRLYSNAQVALFRTRIDDGRVIECNDLMARLMGYSDREECISKAFTVKYVDPESRNKMINLLMEKGQVDNFELKAKRINGELIWLKVSASIYPEKGYLEGAIWDITASKILTPAQNEILELVMQGKSSKQIASELKRSIRTIEDHRVRIMKKLGAQNLVELTKKVLNSGIGQENK